MGLVRMAARTAVISGTATAVSGRVAHRQAQAFAAQAGAPAAAPVPAAGGSDDSAKLMELADLHAKGVLTDEEFAAAKARILGL